MARVSAWSKLTRGGCGPTLAQCLRQKNQGPGKATRVVFNVFSMMVPAVCLSQLGCADRNVPVLSAWRRTTIMICLILPKVGPSRSSMNVRRRCMRVPGPINILVKRFGFRSEEHTSELQSHSDLVCRLLL